MSTSTPQWRTQPAPDPSYGNALNGHPLYGLPVLPADPYARRIGATVKTARFAPVDGLPEHGPADLRYGGPRPITPLEAHEIASQEYGYRRGDVSWLCVSRGADGGFHYRGDAYSEAAARGWAEEQARKLVRRILRGECRYTVTFDAARDRFYLA